MVAKASERAIVDPLTVSLLFAVDAPIFTAPLILSTDKSELDVPTENNDEEVIGVVEPITSAFTILDVAEVLNENPLFDAPIVVSFKYIDPVPVRSVPLTQRLDEIVEVEFVPVPVTSRNLSEVVPVCEIER